MAYMRHPSWVQRPPVLLTCPAGLSLYIDDQGRPAPPLGLRQHNCHTGVSCPLACALHPRQEGGENPKFFYLHHFSRLGCAAPSWKTSWGSGKSLTAIPSRKAKQRNANVCKLMLVSSNLPCLPGREVSSCASPSCPFPYCGGGVQGAD